MNESAGFPLTLGTAQQFSTLVCLANTASEKLRHPEVSAFAALEERVRKGWERARCTLCRTCVCRSASDRSRSCRLGDACRGAERGPPPAGGPRRSTSSPATAPLPCPRTRRHQTGRRGPSSERCRSPGKAPGHSAQARAFCDFADFIQRAVSSSHCSPVKQRT